MGFRKDCYAKVWEIYPPEEGRKTCKVQLSISKKNKDGGYEQDFSDFCVFIGPAFQYATTKLMKGDRIKLTEVDVSTFYNKEKQRQYVTFKVFNCEAAGGGGTPAPESTVYPFDTADQEDIEMTSSGSNDDDPF